MNGKMDTELGRVIIDEEVIKTLLEKHVNIVLCDHVGREALEFALSVNMKIIGGFTGKPINAIYKLLSKDETFFHKLRYAREKDFQDYDKLKLCLNIEKIKMFAKLFRDAKSCVTHSHFDGPSRVIFISDGIEPDIF